MRGFIIGLIMGVTFTFGICYNYYNEQIDNIRLQYIQETLSAIEEANF